MWVLFTYVVHCLRNTKKHQLMPICGFNCRNRPSGLFEQDDISNWLLPLLSANWDMLTADESFFAYICCLKMCQDRPFTSLVCVAGWQSENGKHNNINSFAIFLLKYSGVNFPSSLASFWNVVHHKPNRLRLVKYIYHRQTAGST